MKKTYIFLAVGVCLTVLTASAGCKTEISGDTPSAAQTEYSSDSIERDGQESGVTPEMIYEARCPYIGETSAVGKLAGLLKSYYGITQDSVMELQTDEMPYGMTLHFERKPDNVAMQKMAVVLLELIENCRSVTWVYPLDEQGNRESVYFSYEAMQSVLQNAAASAYTGEELSSEENVWSLSVLEEIKEEYPTVKREKSIEQAVGASVLLYNKDLFSYSETAGEGHLIMETEEEKENGEDKGNAVTVYALSMYGGYEFQNGNFVKNAGTGVIPVVIQLFKEPDGTYFMKHYQRPRDGGDFADSIRELFPEALWERCISPSDAEREELTAGERAYAEDYLRTIGRETAKIGDYADFSYVSLTDAGFSVEASNKLLGDIKYITDPIVAYAPSWLGSVERLEDGVRYIYQLSGDPETFEIIFTRSKYLTKEPGERIIYDSVTGEFSKE